MLKIAIHGNERALKAMRVNGRQVRIKVSSEKLEIVTSSEN